MGILAGPVRLGRDVLQWQRSEPIRPRAILAALLGMAVPVAAGYFAGHLDIGLTIGLGAMLLSVPGTAAASNAQERPKPVTAVVPALLAVTTATAIAGASWTDAATILLVTVAALLTGYSRPLAVAAIRFSIYLVLSVGLLDGMAGHRGAAALIFGMGALWNIAVRMMLMDRAAAQLPAPPAVPERMPTPAQRRAHWRRSLRALPGWQFPIRLGVGLTAASLVRHLWPSHHFYWVMLTVALLTERPVEHLPVKTLQRMLGTVTGVALTWLILTEIRAPFGLAIATCLLATAVPFARARSYLLYSALSTPVILLVIDLNRAIEPSLLTDRLIATLAGAGIVLTGNLLLDRLLARAQRRAAAAARNAAETERP